jgi:uncharacterized protein YfbU (UPF0304 family)
MHLTFTPAERLIVMMLADLMDEAKAKSEIDPVLVKQLVLSDNEWALTWEYPGIFDGTTRSEADVDETADILDMWSGIERSVEDLEAEEQADIKALRWQFSGFDGNNDPHFGIAKTFIKRLDNWQEFKDRDLNSHSRATLPRYRKLLPKYQALVEDQQGEPLTAPQLRDLLQP